MDKPSWVESQIWFVAVAFGLVGQALFAWAGIGLNAAILAGLVLLTTVFVLKKSGGAVNRSALLWCVPIGVGAVGLVLVDSVFLQWLNITMVLAGCGMLAFHARREIGDGALMNSLVALFGWVLLWCEGVVVMFSTKLRRRELTEEDRERAKSVGRGMAIATPLLLVFGVLLANADPIFSRMLVPSIEVDVVDLWQRFLLFGGFAVFGGGMFSALAGKTTLPTTKPPLSDKAILGATEFNIVFASLSLLFLAFLGVQARYLFGGSDVVLATEGLTYAQYARRGFFELVISAALAIPTVLGMLSLVRVKGPNENRWVQGLGVGFLSLVGALLFSAAMRMGLYVDVYGLTELRFYTIAAMGWLGSAVLILGALVLTKRQGRAGTWLVATAMGSVFLTTLTNPDRVIAMVNLSRPAETMTVDTDYLLTLGSGVVEPLFAASENELDGEGQELRRRLTERYGNRGDIRSWTLSREVAFRAVRR